MKKIFKTLRFITTTSMLYILLNSFGFSDWHTWVIWGLMWASMFCDFMATES
jgi:hypothetical protein|nr:MAG TPA: hypothetical protein [Caudoviricetes sp.]